VHQYLATKYRESRFNAVIDAFGVQDLYTHCAEYLMPGKPFATVGIALKEYTVSCIFQSMSLMLSNALWPSIFGGGQREYANITGIANLEVMEKLGRWVEEGKLKVVVNSCWDMEDALKV
jgi:hypothetical protein